MVLGEACSKTLAKSYNYRVDLPRLKPSWTRMAYRYSGNLYY